MRKIKVTWNGEPLKYIYPHASKWQVFKYKVRMFVNKVLIVTGIALVLTTVGLSSYAFGQVSTTEIKSSITGNYDIPPVLQRIANCESGNNQLSPLGQVQMHWNSNGTVDVGKYAINTVWFKQATSMKLDLTKPADNLQFAEWLYHNKGTGAWSASQKCWQ